MVEDGPACNTHQILVDDVVIEVNDHFLLRQTVEQVVAPTPASAFVSPPFRLDILSNSIPLLSLCNHDHLDFERSHTCLSFGVLVSI